MFVVLRARCFGPHSWGNWGLNLAAHRKVPWVQYCSSAPLDCGGTTRGRARVEESVVLVRVTCQRDWIFTNPHDWTGCHQTLRPTPVLTTTPPLHWGHPTHYSLSYCNLLLQVVPQRCTTVMYCCPSKVGAALFLRSMEAPRKAPEK